jgi:hypothetical protein
MITNLMAMIQVHMIEHVTYQLDIQTKNGQLLARSTNNNDHPHYNRSN